MKLQRILARAIIGVSCLLTLALTFGMYLEMTTRNAQHAAVPLQLMVERCVNETSALLQTGQSCAQRIAQGGAATRALQPVDGEREAAIAVVEMSAAARDNLPVLLVNLQGRVVSANEMALNGLQIEQNILDLMQKSGGVIITPRTEALYANAPPCVAAVSPVERGGARVGYALVRLDVSLFDACVQNIARLPHSTLVMFDSAGAILSAEGDDVEYASLSQLVNASDLNAKKSESDAFTLRLKGNKLRAAYRRIESAHWNVLCTLKPMNLGGTWWWLLLPAAVVALFAVWLCLLLNKVLERSYTVPMRALSESILQIEAGDYTRSVPHLGKTELGEVGTAFNSMLARIRRDHRELSVKEARYRILNEQTNSIIFEYDIETGKVQCSPNGRMLDNYPACMQSFPDNIIAREDCCARDAKMLSKLFCEMKRGRVNGEMDLQLCTYNGSQCWFHLQLSDITDEVSLKPLRVVGKLTDIDAEKREAQSLAYLAERDPLTRLYNKETTHSAIVHRMAVRGSHLSALLIADVDNFKHVNDSFGHQKGDAVLTEIAKVLCCCMGEENVTGRMGGDEFMMWIDSAQSRDEVQQKAQEICAAARRVVLNDETGETASMSIGIALCPQDGITYQQLYAHADNGLYAVKRSGKDSCAFYRDEA